MDGFQHQPVMAREVLELLAPVPVGTVVDATVGGGGHARLLLEARPDVALLGIDRDADAVAATRQRLAAFGDRARIVHGGFEDVADIVHREMGVPASEGNIMAILFDLGTSSPQLDRSERGFTYWGEAPLDMRMDAAQELTAAIVVNEYPETRLAEIIATNGEERFARADRGRASWRGGRCRRPPTSSTRSRRPCPHALARHGGHPARRTFQAIRMEVEPRAARTSPRASTSRCTCSRPEGGSSSSRTTRSRTVS